MTLVSLHVIDVVRKYPEILKGKGICLVKEFLPIALFWEKMEKRVGIFVLELFRDRDLFLTFDRNWFNY